MYVRERLTTSQFYRSRTKNRMLYLTLGGKEFFANSQRYLERRIQLECDGEIIKLPQRLQGVVFLNIPSYMAGTNFWGTEREKEVSTYYTCNPIDPLPDLRFASVMTITL